MYIISELTLADRVIDECDLDRGDVELKDLAQDLEQQLLESRSKNTNTKYSCYFNRFKNFMIKHKKHYLPAKGPHVALYLSSLVRSNVSHNVVSSSVFAIKWKHDLYALPDPTVHPFVKNLLQSSKRRPRKPVCKKDAISPNHIRDLFLMYNNSTDLTVLRDLALIVLCFSAFLRFDEVSNLKCKHISFQTGYVKVHIEKSKTDQYRDGREVLVAELDSVACPVKAVKKYIDKAGINLDSDHYLFKPMFKCKSKAGLISSNKRLSYTRARESVVNRMKEVAPQLNLGLHSLRAGGATAAANSGAVNDRCWKRHGRWKSDTAKDGYVKDNVQNRLKVSQNLGL